MEGLTLEKISSTRTMLIMRPKIQKKISIHPNIVVKFNFIS